MKECSQLPFGRRAVVLSGCFVPLCAIRDGAGGCLVLVFGATAVRVP